MEDNGVHVIPIPYDTTDHEKYFNMINDKIVFDDIIINGDDTIICNAETGIDNLSRAIDIVKQRTEILQKNQLIRKANQSKSNRLILTSF
jgi:hypothetical protein